MNILTILRRTDEAAEFELEPEEITPDLRTTLEKFESGLETTYTTMTGRQLRLENQISELTEELRQTAKCIAALDAAMKVMEIKP